MYLSQLLIDVGSNPDRPRPGRAWLRNLYHVHQRLSMAFPSHSQLEGDPFFLKPFSPEGFLGTHVVPDESKRTLFLFRVDYSLGKNSPRVVILVQSEVKPDWKYAFQNVPMFLAARPQTTEYNPQFEAGQALRYRICVNLSRKTGTGRDAEGVKDLRQYKSEKTDAQGRPKSQGKRVAWTWPKEEGKDPQDFILPWFSEKGARKGFALGDSHLMRLGWVSGQRPGNKSSNEEDDVKRRMKFRSALLEGQLTVTDASLFGQTLALGIGSAKSFGFGLLSVVAVPVSVAP